MQLGFYTFARFILHKKLIFFFEFAHAVGQYANVDDQQQQQHSHSAGGSQINKLPV